MTQPVTTSYGVVDPKAIKIIRRADGSKLNPRGEIHDTTGLQDSIREAGFILKPLIVRTDGDGQMWLIDGDRRRAAAIALGWKEVPYAAVDVPESKVLDLMLITNVREEFPTVVLDGAGEIVGGVAKAVASLLSDKGMTNVELARLMGIHSDVVGAYVALRNAPVAVRRAVESGRLSITGFARMKHAPADVQEKAVAPRDPDNPDEKIPVSRVREILREEADDEGEDVDPTETLIDQAGALTVALQVWRPDWIDPRFELALDALRTAINEFLNEEGE